MEVRKMAQEFVPARLGEWLPPNKGSYVNKELNFVFIFLLLTGMVLGLNGQVTENVHWLLLGLTTLLTFALGRSFTTWWEVSRAASETRKKAILVDYRAEDEIRRYGELRKQTINAVNGLVESPHSEFIRATRFFFNTQTTSMESTLKSLALEIDSLNYNSTAGYSGVAFLSEKRQRIAEIDREVAGLLAMLPHEQALILSGTVNPQIIEKVLESLAEK